MLACSTGLSDCVQLLAMKKADFTKFDDNGRGCLQLAMNAQGDGQRLATWLKDNVPGIPSSDGKGRENTDKARGMFSSSFRQYSGPDRFGRRRHVPPSRHGADQTWAISQKRKRGGG